MRCEPVGYPAAQRRQPTLHDDSMSEGEPPATAVGDHRLALRGGVDRCTGLGQRSSSLNCDRRWEARGPSSDARTHP